MLGGVEAALIYLPQIIDFIDKFNGVLDKRRHIEDAKIKSMMQLYIPKNEDVEDVEDVDEVDEVDEVDKGIKKMENAINLFNVAYPAVLSLVEAMRKPKNVSSN
jgi:hypothetical protein